MIISRSLSQFSYIYFSLTQCYLNPWDVLGSRLAAEGTGKPDRRAPMFMEFLAEWSTQIKSEQMQTHYTPQLQIAQVPWTEQTPLLTKA